MEFLSQVIHNTTVPAHLVEASASSPLYSSIDFASLNIFEQLWGASRRFRPRRCVVVVLTESNLLSPLQPAGTCGSATPFSPPASCRSFCTRYVAVPARDKGRGMRRVAASCCHRAPSPAFSSRLFQPVVLTTFLSRAFQVVYFGRCLPFVIIDRIPYFNKWKLQPGKVPTAKQQWDCTKLVLLSHFTVELPQVRPFSAPLLLSAPLLTTDLAPL